MSILANYREKEELMRRLKEEMRKMEENQQLKKELDFKSDIEAVLEKHGRSLTDLSDIFGLSQEAPVKSGRGNRRSRKLKIYQNPQTQEKIETRGGNHRILKEWKKAHGAETVEGWLIEERD
ncbi:histone-like nucleoid-structuring protein, MvaT/MvaU family [Marinospirillum sp. MEB164]|uniref:Histone-like nucleoid-structuring protein, MvaT/MvaU family n=1 Tax=Marinospirillum alkalitolerans TaxID=3123374 RepID=A0ABW8PX90_9GAMM